MTQLTTAHTSGLDAASLRSVRALLDDGFDGDFSAEDWEHSLGGVHALLWEKGELIGHGSVVQRRILHAGRALRAGYVEALAVRSDRRRRGHGGRLMTALERVVRDAYALGALSATEEAVPFYRARGWQEWLGPTSALGPHGVTATPDDDGGVFVLTVAAPLDVTGALTCDWRDGDLW